MPVWGAVVGHDLYTYAERDTVKARNLARDDRAVVHLESAEDVLIVHGRFEDLGRPQDAGSVLRAFDAKYDEPGDRQYLPSADPSFDVLYRLQPARALLWSLADYAESQRRWPGVGPTSGADPWIRIELNIMNLIGGPGEQRP